MGDVWNIQDLWLMYSTYTTNGGCMERPHFTVDIQDMSALRKMVRTPRTDQAPPPPPLVWQTRGTDSGR